MPRHARLLLLLLSALAAPAAAARADDGVSIAVEVGFGGLYRADHWAPITVTVSGGERAFNGALALTYQQDPTQRARIIAPFAATPGRDVPVPIVAALPEGLDRLDVEVLNERGRSLTGLTLSTASADGPLLPGPIVSTQAIVLTIGAASFDTAAAHWRREAKPPPEPVVTEDGLEASSPPMSEADRLGALRIVQRNPAHLPRAWAAYDTLLAVVADASTAAEIDPRALDAIRTWVRAGGMLVLVADGPGPEWRAWFPVSAEGDVIDAGPPTAGPVPGEPTALLAGAGFDAAAEAPHRPLRLTARGAAMGWRLSWLTDQAGEGLIVTGPVGHGLVVVLGADPARAPAQVSSAAGATLWRSAVRPVVKPWLDQAEEARAGNPWMYTHQGHRQRAVVAAIDRVAAVPRFGIGVFIVLGIGGLLLAAMLGPGDAYLLGRARLRHRSWLTALAWIGVCSAIAYAIPLVWRTGPSRLGRYRVIDTIADADGRVVSAWQTACTGLFASRAGMVELDGVPPDSWWHGVSPISFFERSGGVPRPLVSGQSPGLAPGNPITSLHASIWTFRTLQDESSPAPAPAARLSRVGDLWRVEVMGLPEDARVLDGALRIGDRWTGLTGPSRDRAAFVWDAGEPAPDAPLARAWTGREQASLPGLPLSFASPSGNEPGAVLALPGADRRSPAVEWLLDRGGWGAVYLRVEGLSADVSTPGPVEEEHAGVLRLLAPLEGAP